MKQLNTLDTFRNGFKIQRGNEIILLTAEEMLEFSKLLRAEQARDTLEIILENRIFDSDDDWEKEKLNILANDTEWLEELQQDIEDISAGYIDEYIPSIIEERINDALRSCKNE